MKKIFKKEMLIWIAILIIISIAFTETKKHEEWKDEQIKSMFNIK